jgi:hypothetical protein
MPVRASALQRGGTICQNHVKIGGRSADEISGQRPAQHILESPCGYFEFMSTASRPFFIFAANGAGRDGQMAIDCVCSGERLGV